MAKRAKREKRVVSARSYATEHQSGVSLTALSLPEGANLFQVKKAGVINIDIIPYEVKGDLNPYAKKGNLHFERTFYTHRGIGAENSSYCCLRRTFKKKCPICDYIGELSRDPDADSKLIKALAPKERQLWNIIDLSDKEKGIQLFEAAHFNFGKALLAKVKRYDDGRYDLFADLESGLSVEVEFDEEKMGGFVFYKAVGITFNPRRKPYGEEILDEAFCLDEIPREFGYKELKDIFLQKGEDEDEEEEENGEDEEIEEEEEDRPSRSRSRVEKDEENEEDEDDEDEDYDPTASDMGLKVGMKVKHKKLGICEIVHISGDGTSLRLEDDDEEVHRAIAPSECKVIDKKPKQKVEEDEEEDEEEEKPRRKKISNKKPPKDDDDDDEWEDD